MPEPDHKPYMSNSAEVGTTRLDAALAHIRAHAGAAVQGLARMVAVDTRFPPGAGYSAFACLMEGLIAPLVVPLGLPMHRVEVPPALWHVPGSEAATGHAQDARVNLIAGPGGHREKRDVCGLYFHVDTVPVAQGWTRDPFKLSVEGDRLYGLGAADMKGTIAAVLLALRAAAACRLTLAYDPMLLFCTDEEGGLYPGIRYLAEKGELAGHILNFNGAAAPRIWAGCFGMFNLLVRLRGRGAHAGDPGGAVNVIHAALPVLRAIDALRPIVAERVSALPPPPHALGPLAASLSIARAHGGTGASQVPSCFEIVLNRRYPPEEDFATARAELEAAIRAASPPDVAVEIVLVGHLIPTADPTGPHWPRWQRALSLGFGYAADEFRAWGSATCSDFGFVQQAGMREVLLGGLARTDRNVHAADEFTTLADIVALAQSVLTYLAADFAPELLPTRDDLNPPGKPAA
jgi:succinyl-diaminopimelate desuccinylase